MSADVERLLPPATLGVIGCGQLGRMFVQAAQRMGYRTIVLAVSADSPAAQIAHEVVIGPPDEPRALDAFARKAEAVTVEFENVSAPALRWLGRRVPTRPGFRPVWISQNRLREKAFLRACGLPTAPWHPVCSEVELDEALATLGTPIILKTAASGYDGKGQIRVERAEDALVAWTTLNRVPCVAEGVVSFEAEVSVLVARGADGSAVNYPVGLNRHERHILDSTVMPAPIGPIVTQDAYRFAHTAVRELGMVGVMCVEFFLKADGTLLINELAPRPHNSGHLTIEAAATSQFEQQVRALCGLPLGPTALTSPAAMANLLGDLWVHGSPRWESAMKGDPALKLHLYGKQTALPGRKMGHLTVLDPDLETALARVLKARGSLPALAQAPTS